MLHMCTADFVNVALQQKFMISLSLSLSLSLFYPFTLCTLCLHTYSHTTHTRIQICPAKCVEDAETAPPLLCFCYHSEGGTGHESGNVDRGETPQCTAATGHLGAHHIDNRAEAKEHQHTAGQATL